VQSLPVAAAVLVLTLYPYVYLLARVAFRESAATPYGAARTLGLRPLQAARRVVLPLARPSIAAGGLLVALETLSDFATVQYFGVDTLSVGIYRVWRGQFDRPAATVLAMLVLLLALALLAGERWLRRGARFSAPLRDPTPMAAVRLAGWRAWAATGACSAVLLLAVVVPLVTLALWSTTTPLRTPDGSLDRGLLAAAANSVLLAGQAALAVVVLSVLLVHAARVDGRRRVRLGVQATVSGYAVPGPVLAIGALLVLAAARDALDALGLPGGGELVTGSVTVLVLVYTARFLALGYTTTEARLASVSPALTSAALSLGARPRRVLTGVHLPLARSGIAGRGRPRRRRRPQGAPHRPAAAAVRLRHAGRAGVAARGRLALRDGRLARPRHRRDCDDPCRAALPRGRRRRVRSHARRGARRRRRRAARRTGVGGAR
jgi:iron(III) transport system permease protein